jgi:hypothetical protein
MISVLLMKACKQRSRGAVKRFQFPPDGLFLVGTISAEAMMDARLKDPLIFRQCIHLRDVAVLLNRGSYVEQYD